jgi:cytochrome o ubiquinol oxidase operon protein cyoD
MKIASHKYLRIRRNYTIGFFASVSLTGISFGLVKWNVIETMSNSSWKKTVLILSIVAIAQVLLQAKYFLDLDSSSSTWKKVFFASMLFALGVLLVGSLWIMQNLNYNMMHMSPNEIDQAIIEDEIKYHESVYGSPR